MIKKISSKRPEQQSLCFFVIIEILLWIIFKNSTSANISSLFYLNQLFKYWIPVKWIFTLLV
ncbi:hypothetical protein BpHYR1_014839 [Brachionus plicatilis]|uniref:Uncharacterized protein n=1 Tax=Brachionus plicatilis TaxID=10195 RepID=A0A3M7QIU9_BRAPC|nr:hypothetical protein BpHYR1_014839 [Brachionus plicatilis]